jgi:hypothetical protein
MDLLLAILMWPPLVAELTSPPTPLMRTLDGRPSVEQIEREFQEIDREFATYLNRRERDIRQVEEYLACLRVAKADKEIRECEELLKALRRSQQTLQRIQEASKRTPSEEELKKMKEEIRRQLKRE